MERLPGERLSRGTSAGIREKQLGFGKEAYLHLSYRFVASPIGRLQAIASPQALVAVLWKNDSPGHVRFGEVVEEPGHRILQQTATELAEYFAGERTQFSVPLDMRGTPFQQQVWAALLTIPYGQTRTYGQLASQLGNPRATRAVGAASGKNPIAILAPCHRVLGCSGKLTGFAGGLEAKAHLLHLERQGDRLFR